MSANEQAPRLALIWAQAANGVIGRDGRLPWRLPDEMAHFKRTTMGKPVVMGRGTWTGRALPGRTNIVVSRAAQLELPAGVLHARSLDEALETAAGIASRDAVPEYFVIGGRSLYAESWPRAERLYATFVQADVEGDVVFPTVDWSAFVEVERRDHGVDERHAHAFSIRVFDRR